MVRVRNLVPLSPTLPIAFYSGLAMIDTADMVIPTHFGLYWASGTGSGQINFVL
jgi:hypothetical protein